MNSYRQKYVLYFESILDGSVSLSELKGDISVSERKFFNMLFMSAFRHLTFIKTEVLPLFVKKKIPNKQKILKSILYLGITELLFLNTPDYATVNSYVEIAKAKTDKFGANFVNAILRNVLKNKESILSNRKNKYFSSDFLKILKHDYTRAEISEMEMMANIEPPLDLTFKSDVSIKIDDGFLLPTGSLRLPAHTQVEHIPGFNEGLWWVQDAASALVVKCLSDLKGKKVLDLCAAPGGKTAQLLDAGAFVTAVDISEKRLQRLRENMQRLHFSENLKIICADALKFNTDKKFDFIVIDAPCSATGTYRRHPEIMNTKTLDDVLQQADLQQKIINHTCQFLSPQGILSYSTCSLSKKEGEEQIYHFLEQHNDFEILPITLDLNNAMYTKERFLRILPYHLKEFSGIDGFFIATLQRKI